MKQIELAQQLGISKSYLSMILSGQRKGNPELVKNLRSLGVVNFEASSSLRGRCPKPLDECATKNKKLAALTSLYIAALHIISIDVPKSK